MHILSDSVKLHDVHCTTEVVSTRVLHISVYGSDNEVFQPLTLTIAEAQELVELLTSELAKEKP